MSRRVIVNASVSRVVTVNQGKPGSDGVSSELRVSAGWLEGRTVQGEDASPWVRLFDLSTLAGDDGDPGDPGAPGASVEIRATATHIQRRYVTGAAVGDWVDLVAFTQLEGDRGADGTSVELRATETHLQSRRVDVEGVPVTDWSSLISLSSLKGDQGESARIVEVTATGGAETGVEVGGTDLERTLAFTIREASDGVDGFSVEIRATATHVQARQVRGEESTAWANLVALVDLKGAPGASAMITGATASTVAFGQSATVTLGGSATERTFAFGIPAGQPGAQGASGMPNTDLVGTGMPNGVVTASPGTVYKDTFTSGGLLGTNGASLWIKVSGTNTNTGWAVLRGDTGWRRIATPAAFNQAYGFINFRRINDEVTFLVSDVWPLAAGEIMISAGGATGMPGFRPTGRASAQVWREGVAVANSLLGWKSAGLFYQSAGANSWTYATLTALTAEAWPTGALIGTPV